MAFKRGMTVDVCMAYMLMLVSMTSTVMQGHFGSATAIKKTTPQRWIMTTTNQAISIKFATMIGHFLSNDLDFEKVYRAWPACFIYIYTWHHQVSQLARQSSAVFGVGGLATGVFARTGTARVVSGHSVHWTNTPPFSKNRLKKTPTEQFFFYP